MKGNFNHTLFITGSKSTHKPCTYLSRCVCCSVRCIFFGCYKFTEYRHNIYCSDRCVCVDTTWTTTRVRRRGSGRSRCRRAGRCGATRAAACTTWTTTRAPRRGSGPTPSGWRASSTGAASGATWSRRATSASCTRTRRTSPTPTTTRRRQVNSNISPSFDGSST